MIQISVDKSQRRFQFSAAHFQEFIEGGTVFVFVKILFIANVCYLMLHIPTDIHWHKGWPGLALIRKEVASL